MKWQVLGWGKRARKNRDVREERERERERDKTAKYLVLESPGVRGGCGLVDPLEGVLTGNY